ncbi:MAG: ABC transporter ATP-binding protein [Christensenellaceae bacterium]
MALIEIRDFSFAYPNGKTPAVKNINLTVQAGEYILLCGKSGSGKTTLLRSLKSEIAPVGKRSGAIMIGGKAGLTAGESARTIGFVMQDPDSQIVTDTVWHELAFGLENLGIDTETIRRRVAEAAHFFGIQSWFDKSVFELSGGQKQILNLAAITAMQTEIVVLDEPTAQLDPIAAKEFLQMLLRINSELGKTVILSEHRLDDVLPACGRAVYMDGGAAGFSGPPRSFAEFLHTTANPSTKEFGAALPAPARLACKCGAKGPLPLTVREGRDWLEKTMQQTPLCRTQKPAQANAKTLLQAKDIWHRYKKQDDFALRGLDLEIRENTLHCIVGGNGSGKSTLLGVLSGIFKPARGRLKWSRTLNIGMLYQNPKTLFVCDTLMDDLKEHKPQASEEEIMRVVSMMGLDGLLARHPYDLSGGEMQKAALAKLLLLEPDLLLLDEPVKGLDAFSKAELGQAFQTLVTQGKTIVIVTHDLEFAAKYATHCSMVFRGCVIAESPADDFFRTNSFYTTSASRMTRGIMDECSTIEEISKCETP